MPPVIRHGVDNTSGHCYAPTPIASGSPDVEVNGQQMCRVSDPIVVHCCPGAGCHGGNIASGSPDTEANGLAVARNGDPIDCGDSCSNGSGNVICN